MFLLQAALFFIMPSVSAFALFAILAFVIALCYGGGFGTMPAFAADYFGAKNVGPIYGLMLTAWGTAGVVGPLLIAFLRQSTGGWGNALYIIAGIMLVSAIVPFIVRPPKAQPAAAPSETVPSPSPAGPLPTPAAQLNTPEQPMREREVGS
jgi:OFA family oxalate/formate antiporter-like MFS transporter